MKVHSYTAIHYGKDYLPYAIQSIYPLVDQINIFYTPHPSHGHQTSLMPIETEEEIWEAAFTYDPEYKVHFFRSAGFTHEGPQRDYALKSCKDMGADLVLVQDYDEIWDTVVLEKALKQVWDSKQAIREWRINFTHFWRSFDYVCKDEGWPARIHDMRNEPAEVGYIPKEFGDIWHFGYAIKSATLRYKLAIHGHHNEFRPKWLEEKWYPFAKEDVHPTNDKGFWNAIPYDKTNLPAFMQDHPFYNLEMIP